MAVLDAIFETETLLMHAKTELNKTLWMAGDELKKVWMGMFALPSDNR